MDKFSTPGEANFEIKPEIKVWDIESEKCITTIQIAGVAAPVYSLVFSPDGRLLASGGDGIKLWDVASGEYISTLPGLVGTYSIDFSPDGKLLAAGSAGDGTILFWDVASLNTQIRDRSNIAVTPKGKRFIT